MFILNDLHERTLYINVTGPMASFFLRFLIDFKPRATLGQNIEIARNPNAENSSTSLI